MRINSLPTWPLGIPDSLRPENALDSSSVQGLATLNGETHDADGKIGPVDRSTFCSQNSTAEAKFSQWLRSIGVNVVRQTVPGMIRNFQRISEAEGLDFGISCALSKRFFELK